MGQIATNLGIERYHRTIKDNGVRRSDRIDQLCDRLQKVERLFQRKEAMIRAKIRGDFQLSAAQSLFRRQHPNDFELSLYILKVVEGQYHLKKYERPAGVGAIVAQYELKPSLFKCTLPLCQVTCNVCPVSSPCAHHLQCTCLHYARKRSCKQMHVVAMQTNNLRQAEKCNDLNESSPNSINASHPTTGDEESDGKTEVEEPVRTREDLQAEANNTESEAIQNFKLRTRKLMAKIEYQLGKVNPSDGEEILEKLEQVSKATK
ncbi:hypothetical protein TCAL_05530 [Tigriopus californicus]|uniref:Uncharacterized protein n=1 Tax=Tigriopus californicus TaxID=6832 RepID=A0A553PTW2_TIGCA|nr:uncharacterized protein LOC131891240 [Tigriopus californicus]XP_059096748.1 uncharacterized protein LOC131891240 [Tigriopus californicus]TRY81121.1 hypothetical protein TCAL_05530 [Tigriopus californicus]